MKGTTARTTKHQDSTAVVPVNIGESGKLLTEHELLTGDELCEKLKIRKCFLYAPVRRKGPDPLPCVKVGKYLRYDLHAVRDWIIRQNQPQV